MDFLVVDDDEDILLLLKRLFEKKFPKSAIFTSNSAEEAVEQLETLRPQLESGSLILVSDIRLPGASGIQLARQTLGKYPTLPIILVTAYEVEFVRVESESLGVRRVIQKLDGPESILEEIGKVFEENSRTINE